ncbi:serine carboxypeptidase S28-domain-containing protein [Pseudoneurospora amorphoporcata]|uniref:Serine carboxypeptidase S28-domain-containing protein n=1 Tax=Pseudoneurospora amorphoporcata TaxID=241081 RepID=A0AAN6NTB1_9PEZI|nr:serine carboxypeptidase S28-domain-containing protein [Pseudoneurospora amorphoporcata]
MKLSPGAVLPFAAWTAPKASLRGTPEITPSSTTKGVSLAINNLVGASCGWFEQPVDYNDPKLGTWQQQYCVSREWWAGPGSPVVFMTPGEEPIIRSVSSSLGYTFLQNTTMPGMYAQAIGTVTVVLEHRYFGGSSPYDSFDSETLQYLTTKQAAADIDNFAQKIQFRFDKNQTSNSPKAASSSPPWIYYGASYTATIGSWIEQFHLGVFHAFHLSSAIVEANPDNWYYYDTIRQGIDALWNGTKYGNGASCSLALNIVNTGKETGGYKDILRLCNAVVADNHTIDGGVLGTVPAPVKNFASYFVQKFIDSTCTYFDVWGQDDPLWCLNTHDLLNPFFEARTLGNPWRTYLKANLDMTPGYWQRQCEMHFPTAENGYQYGSAKGKTTEMLNKRTGGWRRVKERKRVVWTNGNKEKALAANTEFDPWGSTAMSSELRPGGPLKLTEDAPVFLIKNAQHADDAFTEAGMKGAGHTMNPEVVKVQEKAVEIMKGWVAEFKAPAMK